MKDRWWTATSHCQQDSSPTSPFSGRAYPGIPVCLLSRERDRLTPNLPLQAPRTMIILTFPDSPSKPAAVRASTAVTVTVDGKTAIAAGRRYPEPLRWEPQGSVKVRAGRAGLVLPEHLSSWPEAISVPSTTHTGRENEMPWIWGF